MRNFLRGLMYGRYGNDQLNLFLMILCLADWIACLLIKQPMAERILSVLGYLLVFCALFRCMSRNYHRRREENGKFLAITGPITRTFRQKHAQTMDRDHKYFRCPGCGQLLRVPRGKGRITISCRNCGASFEKKT